ncbi:MAG: four helix bundle protein [Clostridia bacterium]|nr:four helix bundle protein [Clostridia bacterium]
MKENILIDLSKQFAVEIIYLCKEISEKRNGKILSGQLLRSGTSIGANLHEGNFASSKADFINKFQIALKECYETEYWLDILNETKYITNEEYEPLYALCCKLRKIISASINTAKGK